MAPWIPRALAAAAWAGLAAGIACGHPVLSRGGSLGDLAQGLAEDAARGRVLASRLALFDRGALPALVALEAALLYVAGWLLLRLPRAPGPAEGRGGGAALALACAAAGHGAGVLAALGGGGELAFLLATNGTAAGLLWIAGARTRDPAPSPAPRCPPGRVVAGLAGGILLVLLAAPLDAVLASAAGTPLFPEPWLPVAIRLGSGEGVAGGLLLAGALAASLSGLERLAGGGGPRAGALVLAPAFAFVLGASNPIKALALAAAAGRLATAGVGWPLRGLFALATVAVFVAIACAL
ncbi:MAG: hypothetical protein L0216_07730 [Planctomycetales bacterium]|nr:hypothetical protein [Planctomycetales bacterium]